MAALRAFLILLLCGSSALAQGNMIQGGAVTRGHAPVAIQAGGPGAAVWGDAGPALAGALTELGISASGTPFCINNVAPSSPGIPPLGHYYQLCMGADPTGIGAQLTWNSYGGTPKPLTFNINGTNYAFPSALTGITGPGVSTVGDIATFANTSGSVVQDSGVNINSAGNFNIAPSDMTLRVNPLGNTFLSTTAFNLQGTSPSGATPIRNYMMNIGLTANNNVGQGDVNGANVSMYISAVATANAGNVWAINPLVTADNLSPIQNHHQVSELDINNNLKNVDPTGGPSGIQFPVASNTPTGGAGSGQLYIYGEVIECGGAFDCTAAVDVDGSNYWLRGIGMGPTADVLDASFYDYGNAAITLDVHGSHTNIIDVSNSTATNDISRGNVWEITSAGVYRLFSTAHTGDQVLQVGGDNNGLIVLGSGGGGITSTPQIAVHTTGVTTADFVINGTGNLLEISSALGGLELTVGSTAGGVGVGTGNSPIANGDVNASTYHVAGVAGVSCSGSPSGSFASVHGIVTHC